mmetsp:Transcript_30526/g.34960  ORF Transcript_30526/g.34960 Transcript_30526/m.34960 type:complete len:100 (+) Transcript_30526:403-702(+)
MKADHGCQGRPKSKLLTDVYKKDPKPADRQEAKEETKYIPHASTVTVPYTPPVVETVPAVIEKCPICDKEFDDVTKLIEHSESHYSAPKPPIETEKCPI